MIVVMTATTKGDSMDAMSLTYWLIVAAVNSADECDELRALESRLWDAASHAHDMCEVLAACDLRACAGYVARVSDAYVTTEGGS